MKGKLIKTGDSFLLKDVNDETLAITSGTIQGRMLSLKNCQAIERGYDLDELANMETEKYASLTPKSFKRGFLYGFQKALELMGDKKFSEEDMSKAWSEGYHRRVDEINGNELRYFDRFIQSLQKTEWDVEIKMDDVWDGLDSTRIFPKEETSYPKLDADGCLILKRK